MQSFGDAASDMTRVAHGLEGILTGSIDRCEGNRTRMCVSARFCNI